MEFYLLIKDLPENMIEVLEVYGADNMFFACGIAEIVAHFFPLQKLDDFDVFEKEGIIKVVTVEKSEKELIAVVNRIENEYQDLIIEAITSINPN